MNSEVRSVAPSNLAMTTAKESLPSDRRRRTCRLNRRPKFCSRSKERELTIRHSETPGREQTANNDPEVRRLRCERTIRNGFGPDRLPATGDLHASQFTRLNRRHQIGISVVLIGAAICAAWLTFRSDLPAARATGVAAEVTAAGEWQPAARAFNSGEYEDALTFARNHIELVKNPAHQAQSLAAICRAKLGEYIASTSDLYSIPGGAAPAVEGYCRHMSGGEDDKVTEPFKAEAHTAEPLNNPAFYCTRAEPWSLDDSRHERGRQLKQ